MTEYFTIGIVKEVLKKHPSECVFEIDAPQKILYRLSSRPIEEWFLMSENPEKRGEFLEAWQLSELYCPHEGINRLKEYGIEI